jgi:hypothetical protein
VVRRACRLLREARVVRELGYAVELVRVLVVATCGVTADATRGGRRELPLIRRVRDDELVATCHGKTAVAATERVDELDPVVGVVLCDEGTGVVRKVASGHELPATRGLRHVVVDAKLDVGSSLWEAHEDARIMAVGTRGFLAEYLRHVQCPHAHELEGRVRSVSAHRVAARRTADRVRRYGKAMFRTRDRELEATLHCHAAVAALERRNRAETAVRVEVRDERRLVPVQIRNRHELPAQAGGARRVKETELNVLLLRHAHEERRVVVRRVLCPGAKCVLLR